MLGQFSIWALDDPHLKTEMETVCQVLDEMGIRYKMNAMATTIEGERDEIFDAIGVCHDRLAKQHKRLLINLTLDDDRA